MNDLMEKAQPEFKEEQWKNLSGSDELSKLNKPEAMELLKALGNSKVATSEYLNAQFAAIDCLDPANSGSITWENFEEYEKRLNAWMASPKMFDAILATLPKEQREMMKNC